MNVALLVLGLCCLIGCVYPNDLPSAVKFDAVRNVYDNETDQIVGGSAATAGEFPYMAILSLDGRAFCGGSLIDSKTVLTAAHCLMGMTDATVKKIRVILNSISVNGGSGSVTKAVGNFIRNPNFSTTTAENDIALLSLTSSVSSSIKTIGLPSGSDSYVDKSAVVIGFGRTSTDGSSSSKLLKATVKVLTNVLCQRLYSIVNKETGKNYKIASTMVCAFTSGKDACFGDSGGPLIVNGVQVGIVSFGEKCAKNPGVYTRVTAFVDWIKTNKAKL